MDRHNHYEAAFAAFLRERRVSFLAIDESRRSYDGQSTVKSMDFIVHGQSARFVVDIKGRRFPGGTQEKPRRTWECWATEDDVQDARQWALRFGSQYRALFVFMYHLVDDQVSLQPGETLWNWQDRRYLLRAIAVDEYVRSMKVRSPKWRTVYLPTAVFRQLVRPLGCMLPEVCDEPDQLGAFNSQLSASRQPY